MRLSYDRHGRFLASRHSLEPKKGLSMTSRSVRGFALAAALSLSAGAVLAQDITGAGATFPAPIYAK